MSRYQKAEHEMPEIPSRQPPDREREGGGRREREREKEREIERE
jgi:hypothetical protein